MAALGRTLALCISAALGGLLSCVPTASAQDMWVMSPGNNGGIAIPLYWQPGGGLDITPPPRTTAVDPNAQRKFHDYCIALIEAGNDAQALTLAGARFGDESHEDKLAIARGCRVRFPDLTNVVAPLQATRMVDYNNALIACEALKKLTPASPKPSEVTRSLLQDCEVLKNPNFFTKTLNQYGLQVAILNIYRLMEKIRNDIALMWDKRAIPYQDIWTDQARRANLNCGRIFGEILFRKTETVPLPLEQAGNSCHNFSGQLSGAFSKTTFEAAAVETFQKIKAIGLLETDWAVSPPPWSIN